MALRVCLTVLFLVGTSGTRPVRDQGQEGAQISFLLRGDAAANKKFDAIDSDKDGVISLREFTVAYKATSAWDAKLNSMNFENQQMKQRSIQALEYAEMQDPGGSELERGGSNSTQAASEVSTGISKCTQKKGCTLKIYRGK